MIFSRMIGDKVYGLLVAEIKGFPVPRTTVIGRRIAPFSLWPIYGSCRSVDKNKPARASAREVHHRARVARSFALLQREDPDGTAISSVLSQQGVAAQWSGAAIETSSGSLVVEGIQGTGERLMVGLADPEPIPDEILAKVNDLHGRLACALGACRFEWVFDGSELWIVQLHRGSSTSDGDIIVPGDADEWLDFDVSQGLEVLRSLARDLKPQTGIMLDRKVGLTSHLADVLRKAGVPARVRPR